ncbi:protein phosphatase 2C domain-containing protein [Agrococcus sp. SL85]|uniref:PP2C family protein-serine/threonine phosphatase n=1 Tax=Agrococcus sp. SL85 TaxID=2995141 RepID=UPI00226D17EC|nr:protein phosphatase 2C domain-containing protein [Agrococcus sp. SL85]WAC66323.1 protein phosphatase 2C domain-containing protein [Agrococcus sp. SL85]
MTHIGSAAGEHATEGPEARRFAVRWAGLTDTGFRRQHNEDSLVTQPPVFAVADGMGGHSHGDLASKAVVEHLGGLAGLEAVEPIDVVDALRAATDEIERLGDGDGAAGTTVTGCAFAIHEGAPHFAVFNVGDSRTYAMLGERLTRITTDHSVVQELIDAGLLTEEEAETHPEANVVTRGVGAGIDPVPDYFLLPIMPGLRLLVCSDGLTKEVHDVDIERMLWEHEEPAAAAEALVAAALDHGGRDNVSVIVVDVTRAPTVEDVDRTVPRTTLRDEEPGRP